MHGSLNFWQFLILNLKVDVSSSSLSSRKTHFLHHKMQTLGTESKNPEVIREITAT
jgi:hypothetical protein